MATKKVGASGRLRANYGKRVRGKICEVEKIQRNKQKCPYCSKMSFIRKLSKGIWLCKKCNRKFTENSYFLGGK